MSVSRVQIEIEFPWWLNKIAQGDLLLSWNLAFGFVMFAYGFLVLLIFVACPNPPIYCDWCAQSKENTEMVRKHVNSKSKFDVKELIEYFLIGFGQWFGFYVFLCNYSSETLQEQCNYVIVDLLYMMFKNSEMLYLTFLVLVLTF